MGRLLAEEYREQNEVLQERVEALIRENVKLRETVRRLAEQLEGSA
jgi:hypothetical protein